MNPTIKGLYDHGRLTLDLPPPAELAEVLVTFVGCIPSSEVKPFRPEEFAFDRCRQELNHIVDAQVSDAVREDREERG